MNRMTEGHTVKRFDGDMTRLHGLVLELGRGAVAQLRSAGQGNRRCEVDPIRRALASAIGEGQRILNGMQDIQRVFLTRILTLGMLILVLMTSGFFPVDLRNASAITLFTVGIPTALLAIWSRPGRVPRETLLATLAKFVIPAVVIIGVLILVVRQGLDEFVELGGDRLEL